MFILMTISLFLEDFEIDHLHMETFNSCLSYLTTSHFWQKPLSYGFKHMWDFKN
jgi:hypothetical protein